MLEGKKAIVTGGSAGIGAAITTALVRDITFGTPHPALPPTSQAMRGRRRGLAHLCHVTLKACYERCAYPGMFSPRFER